MADDEAAAEAADQAAAAAPIVEQPHVPKVYGAGNADARIVIRAATDSWVQVEDANENILLSRVLKTGDSYRVPNRDGLTMMTGNAGALDIVVDGQSDRLARAARCGPEGIDFGAASAAGPRQHGRN